MYILTIPRPFYGCSRLLLVFCSVFLSFFLCNIVKYINSFFQVFIVMVSFLTALLIYIAYYVGLPWWWKKSPGFSIVLLVVGNWLLINVCFHYYKGISLPAGHPPINGLIPEAVSICKKCMKPKPPRTHHCSVCNSCVLKMDHHCRILLILI